MKILHEAHYKAALDLVELMSIAGWIAILADCIWVIRDSFTNGFTPGMILVAVLLHLAFIVLSIALYTYHKNKVKEHVKQAVQEKLELCKRKFYHK